jgi:hypothetical protein
MVPLVCLDKKASIRVPGASKIAFFDYQKFSLEPIPWDSAPIAHSCDMVMCFEDCR